jgi:alpha-D-ribose 1-methylphosphonate 5-triphosphate synthase subunit PhnH
VIDHPVYTPQEALARQTFLALMWSLSYPGRAYELPASGADAFHAIGGSLLDLETSYFTPDNELALYLARTGARSLPPDRAAYHFYPTLDTDMLEFVQQASIGTLIYPDQSATLIFGCRLGLGTTFRLQGPGISPAAVQSLQLNDVPSEIWEMRTKANRYPRGWDVYLVDENRVIGIPRTTQMTVED